VVAGIGGHLTAAAERVHDLDWRFLVAALALQLVTVACRAGAWRNILAAAYPEQRLPIFSLGCAYATGMALNAFLPARGGECAKVALARAHIPSSCLPTIAASLTVLLLVDAAFGASLILGLWATGVLPEPPPVPGVGFVPVAVGLAAVSIVALGLVAHRSRATLRGFLSSAARGLAILRSPSRYVSTVLPFQLGAWVCRISVVWLALEAFRIEAGLGTVLLIVVFNGLSTAIPVPGGAGSQQLFATYALQGMISTAAAMSFSVGLQLGTTVLNTTVGLVAAMLLFRTLRPRAAARLVRARLATAS
jgi:glycosyltransferase 2 family protein